MTCADLGGYCSKKLSAYTWNAMVEVIAKHATDKHAKELARELEKMHFKSAEQWAATLKPKWDAAPEQGKTDLRTDPDSDKDKD
jgi:predicted small metal-binding protein